MKIYQKIERLRIENDLIEHSCDICKKKSPSKDPNNWSKEYYETNKVEIEYTDGYSSYGDASGEVTSFDICPECFENKLIPFFKSLGVEPTKYDY